MPSPILTLCRPSCKTVRTFDNLPPLLPCVSPCYASHTAYKFQKPSLPHSTLLPQTPNAQTYRTARRQGSRPSPTGPQPSFSGLCKLRVWGLGALSLGQVSIFSSGLLTLAQNPMSKSQSSVLKPRAKH